MSIQLPDDFFDEDLHQLNMKIIEMASITQIDITNADTVHRLLNEETPFTDRGNHNVQMLRGLIVLRGEMRKEKVESNLPDGPSPIDDLMHILHAASLKAK